MRKELRDALNALGEEIAVIRGMLEDVTAGKSDPTEQMRRFTEQKITDRLLQEAADFNAANWQEKFGDVLFSRDGVVYERESGREVIFTPHGWRVLEDVRTMIPADDGRLF